MIRPLMLKAIELASKPWLGKVPKLVIEAPTGYGKSIGASALYNVFKESGLAESLLHVLPLRSIVRDIYVCTLLNALSAVPLEYCNGRKPPDEIRKALNDAGLTVSDIAYQMGDLIIGESIGEHQIYNKQPLFDAKYVVTTLDSFLYNLFRIPVTELASTKKHYAIPRLRIFVSAIYLDEAHMVFEEENEISTIYTAAKKALELISVFKSPLVIASATMGKKVLDSMTAILGSDVKIVRLGLVDKDSSGMVEVSDKEFIDRMISIKWKTYLLDNREVVKTAAIHASSGLRVLVVRDSVKSAIETYKQLKELGIDNLTLIHGRMTRGDRDKALTQIKKMSKPGIAVSTSVIEAGVNVSFDVLITDGLRPRSVVQRAGRVCREGDCDTALVYVVKNPESERPIDERLLKFVEKAVNEKSEICWRIPFDPPSRNYRGYGTLLDQLEEPKRDNTLEKQLEGLTLPLFVSSWEINDVLRARDYALTRVGLLDLVVGDMEDLKYWEYGDLVSYGLTSSASLIDDVLKRRRDCVLGVVSVWGETNISNVDMICKVDEVVSERGFSMKKFVECVRRAHRRFQDQPPLLVGVLLDKRCYEPGVGLKYW